MIPACIIVLIETTCCRLMNTLSSDGASVLYLSLSCEINDEVCEGRVGPSPLGLLTRLVQQQLDRSTKSDCDVGVSASTQG